MRTVVSIEEMQQYDKTAIRSYGIPSLLLMENAGAGTARWVQDRYGSVEGKAVAVFCGKGNNGGDGMVAARHLANAGARVTVFLFKGKQRGDAAKNAGILEKVRKSMPERLRIQSPSLSAISSYRADIIIDAIFGTGFSGTVKSEYARVIQWMNRQSAPRICIDIPSGVNGTTGEVRNIAVRASATLTLAALKRGLLCNQGRDYVGDLAVLDIGIPESIFKAQKPSTAIVGQSDIPGLLPRRSSTAHKYTTGKVFILAGSRGYTGAAALASSSALRSGAGAVVLGTPDSVYKILARKLTEVIVEPLPSTGDGTLAQAGFDAIVERMQWADTVVIGPGLSSQKETALLLHAVLNRADGSVLLDADALNVTAAEGANLLSKLEAELILTPHTGEFSRLSGLRSKEVEMNRIDHARMFAGNVKAAVVLKGAPTAVASPEGDVILNPTGNAGMATVGSGDVLSGIIGGLWAQGMDRMHACTAGVYLHGLSGDMAAAALGQRSIVAQDLIDFLPHAFRKVEGGGI